MGACGSRPSYWDSSGCVAATRVSGDISINIEDCLLFSPRIVP
jgi:hypothetical protein